MALFVIVAVPALVAQQNKEPAPAEAKLTVRLSGNEGAKGHPVHVKVRAAGQQPTTPTTLVDDSGLKTATVTGDATAGACKSVPTRDSGVGSALWCLKLSDVANGAELSGVASGPGTKLSLTVTRRDAFVWLPLLVLLVGIGVAAIVALAPSGLRRLVRRVALARLLEKNRRSAANDTIGGLDGWVETQLAAGADPSTVLTTIAPVIRHGPERAQAARHELESAITDHPLDAGHPFAAAARAEATRVDNRVEDFLGADGKLRAQHPASEWLAGLTKMKENRDELDAAEQTIMTAITPACRDAAQLALTVARVAFGRIKSLDTVTDLDEPLDDLTKAIDRTLADADCRTDASRLTDEEGARRWHERDGVTTARGVPGKVRSLELPDAGLDAHTILAIVLTLAACLAVLGFAALTVEESAYRDNHAFSSFHDYFTLFAAALASGAAASVLSLLAYWRPDPPTTTS